MPYPMSKDQGGFNFDGEFPHKQFKDDPTPPHTLHRKADPDTSREAAHGINVTKLEQEVYNAVCSFGTQTIIGEDVRPRLPDVHFNSITPRFKALEKKGLITYTGEKRPGQSGRNQRVLIATKFWKGSGR